MLRRPAALGGGPAVLGDFPSAAARLAASGGDAAAPPPAVAGIKRRAAEGAGGDGGDGFAIESDDNAVTLDGARRGPPSSLEGARGKDGGDTVGSSWYAGFDAAVALGGRAAVSPPWSPWPWTDAVGRPAPSSTLHGVPAGGAVAGDGAAAAAAAPTATTVATAGAGEQREGGGDGRHVVGRRRWPVMVACNGSLALALALALVTVAVAVAVAVATVRR